MARLTNVSFDLGGNTYALAIDFDDAALVKETVAFEVTAECVRGKIAGAKVTARVEIHPMKQTIIVSIGGKPIFSLDGFATDSELEKQLDAIPANLFPDPITACAIKAGISAIIGQAIKCFRALEKDRLWQRLSEFFTCMSRNFGSISKVAMYRAFKCIAGL